LLISPVFFPPKIPVFAKPLIANVTMKARMFPACRVTVVFEFGIRIIILFVWFVVIRFKNHSNQKRLMRELKKIKGDFLVEHKL